MAETALLVGLTGGLACGKSTVLALFAGRGAATIDADRLAREAVEDPALLSRLRDVLPPPAFHPDGRLDRAATARLVFSEPARRRALEEILHPEVTRREEEEIRRLAAGASILVCDVPLLIEVGRASRYHRLVVVRCSEPTQLRRAVARGMDADDARRRIAAQMPPAEKASMADYVIDTEASVAETRRRALEVFADLEQDARSLRQDRPLLRRRAGP